jgi:hypothetical protein
MTSVLVFLASFGACDGWFIRGDVDNNGALELVTDWVYLHNTLFMDGPPPCNPDAADVNDDGVLDISDMVALGNWFNGSFEIPAPFPLPGDDPTGDYLQNGTSPLPDENSGLTFIAQAATARAVPTIDRWNDSTDSASVTSERILTSTNNTCNGDNKSQADAWSVSYNASDHKGHATKAALTSQKRSGKRDVVIRISVVMFFFSMMDGACSDRIDSTDKVAARLEQATIKVTLKSLTGKTLVLNKDDAGLLAEQELHCIYGIVTGAGEKSSVGFLEYVFDGADIQADQGVPLFDPLQIESVTIDGIVHRSDVGPDEISKNEQMETHISVSGEYIWRK